MTNEVATFLDLYYRPDTGCVVGRWLRSINEQELRQGYEAVGQLSLAHGCGQWLIDARRRTDRSQNGSEWVIPVFLPQIQAQLHRPLRVAFLVLPQHRAQVAAPPTGAPVQFARFIDEGAANHWLGG